MRPYFCARMISHTALVQFTAPIRWTSITARKSSSSILLKVLSRRMPALLTRMSTRPQRAIVSATICWTCAKSVTDAPLATASPPRTRISSTTRCAAVAEPPRPLTSLPRSLTTTFAPRRARRRACWRPRPAPAPVMMATRSFKLMVMDRSSVLVRRLCDARCARASRPGLTRAAIDVDVVGVEIAVLDDVAHQAAELLGAAHAAREQHLVDQAARHLGRHAGGHAGLEQPRRDR